MFALGGGILLSTNAERFRRRFFEQELRETQAPLRPDLGNDHSVVMQELAASIAHEIRNPITAAKSLVQQMGEDPGSEENVEFAQVAIDELDRVERSVSHLLRFARDEDVVVIDLQLEDLLASVEKMLGERACASGIELLIQCDSPGQMQGDPDKLRRVVLNLVNNALDALEEHGLPGPRIEVQVGDDLAGREVWLRVRDNGPGISEEDQSKIFRAFHTTKEHGTGLGLAISQKIVEAHEGTIELKSSPSSGAEFLLTFPKVLEVPD